MSSYTPQSGDFDYAFAFSQGGIEKNWELHLTNQELKNDRWTSPKEIEIFSGISGVAESIEYKNGFLALGCRDSGFVEAYVSNLNPLGFSAGQFIKLNRLTGEGVTGSGFAESVAISNENIYSSAPYTVVSTGNGSDSTLLSGAGAVFGFSSFLTGASGVTGTGFFGQVGTITGGETSGFLGSSLDSEMFNGVSIRLGVGATGENAGSGRCYIYDGGNFNKNTTINPSGENVKNFGKAQAFASVNQIGYLAIGCERGLTGKVQIYKESSAGSNDYSIFQELTSPEAHAGDGFGNSIYGRTGHLMVGAPNLGTSGKAYYYNLNQGLGAFQLHQTLSASDAAAGQHFGKSCAFGTGTAVITSDLNKGKGYVYVWQNNHWYETGTVTGSLSTANGSFGGYASGSRATEIADDRILVGSVNEEGYVFTAATTVTGGYTGVSFSGHEGKLYDSEGNFIYGYPINQVNTVSGGVFTGGYYSIFVNGNLCRAQAPREPGVGLTGALNSWAGTGISGSGLSVATLNIII